jgi:spore maturation protein CgeB
MLAERTGRHLDFFIEGSEAEFFASKEELLAKIRTYLSNSLEREKIAQAGRKLCLSSGYSMREQLTLILAEVSD